MSHPSSPRLTLLDAVSSPGSAAKPNEDRLGHNEEIALVIDGATGLGDRPVTSSHGSDASWLADLAASHLVENLRGDSVTAEVISELIRDARDRFLGFSPGNAVPRYAWPTASLAMIRLIGDRLEFAGLGDCKALLLRRDGRVEVHSALGDFHAAETEEAARHLERLGRFSQGNLLADPETRASLRAARERQNTSESGIWTLGLVEDAARHLRTVTAPASDYALALLCSDGFSSLVDSYRAFTAEMLLEAASRAGLALLCDEIRRIEREVDPDGAMYPRFKQSDDATAVLVKIEA